MAKKSCPIEENNISYVDYKNVALLREFTTRYAKIKPRRYSGSSVSNQRKVARAVKRARFMALLQYVR